MMKCSPLPLGSKLLVVLTNPHLILLYVNVSLLAGQATSTLISTILTPPLGPQPQAHKFPRSSRRYSPPLLAHSPKHISSRAHLDETHPPSWPTAKHKFLRSSRRYSRPLLAHSQAQVPALISTILTHPSWPTAKHKLELHAPPTAHAHPFTPPAPSHCMLILTLPHYMHIRSLHRRHEFGTLCTSFSRQFQSAARPVRSSLQPLKSH